MTKPTEFSLFCGRAVNAEGLKGGDDHFADLVVDEGIAFNQQREVLDPISRLPLLPGCEPRHHLSRGARIQGS